MINKPAELVIDKICRSCLAQDDNMRNVFEAKELAGQTLQIADMLMDCASVNVSVNDGLPSLLCGSCENKLNLAYEFKQQCQKSDTTLRSLTNPAGSSVDESCDIVVQPDFNIPELFQNSESDNNNDDADDADYSPKHAKRQKRTTASIAGGSLATKRPKGFTCTFCKKVLRTKKGLRIHQRRHTGEKMRSCHVCRAQFTRTHHLIRHMKVHNNATGATATTTDGATATDATTATVGAHVCKECGQSFRKLSHLVSHKKTHHGNKVKKEPTTGDENGGDEKPQVNPGDPNDVTHSDLDDNGAGNGILDDLPGPYDDDDSDDESEDKKKEEEDLLFKSHPPKSKTEKRGIFECKTCFKVMTTAVGLKIHNRRHTGSDLAKCWICEKTFTKGSHLKRHLLTHGINDVVKHKPAEKKVLECEFCDRKFKYRKSFTHHMQTEHGMSDESDVPLSAYVSKLQSSGEGKAKKIKVEGSDEKQSDKDTSMENPTADHEDANLSDPEYAKDGEDEAEDEEDEDADPARSLPDAFPKTKEPPRAKNHVCHVCEAPFSRANHLTRHMTLHRALLIHKCEKCDKAYATDEHLAKHVETEHVNKPYACTICNKPFSRGEHLIRHLKVHQIKEKQNNSACSICEKTFSRSDHLARHIKVHLLQDKRHVCPECGKAFNRLDNLKTHQRIHTGIKDTAKLHLCIYCGKEFNNSSNMIVHMRRHTGERPYKCAQCGKGFPRSHDLKCHERTHSGEKPYQCSVCGKSFNKSNKLLRHTRVHTGERPYVCNICGRAFTQSNDLALHMRRHTGARPYACGMCPARFIQSGQLKAHRRSTGHWMETQPDLKGGHRVEPVTPIIEPLPIKFKKHGPAQMLVVPKKDEDLDGDEDDGTGGGMGMDDEQGGLEDGGGAGEQQQMMVVDNEITIEEHQLDTKPPTATMPKMFQHPTMGLMSTLSMGGGEPMLLDPHKLIGLQNAGLINLVSSGLAAHSAGELKLFKTATGGAPSALSLVNEHLNQSNYNTGTTIVSIKNESNARRTPDDTLNNPNTSTSTHNVPVSMTFHQQRGAGANQSSVAAAAPSGVSNSAANTYSTPPTSTAPVQQQQQQHQAVFTATDYSYQNYG